MRELPQLVLALTPRDRDSYRYAVAPMLGVAGDVLGGAAMTEKAPGFQYRIIPSHMAAVSRRAIKARSEIRPIIAEVASKIPAGNRAGPPFCHFNFITEIEGANDVEIGFPVNGEVGGEAIECRTIPEMAVLSVHHEGSIESLRACYQELHAFTGARALISDEFGREIYPRWDEPNDQTVEINFVRHRWEDLLAQRVERVLGAQAAAEVLAGRDSIGFETMAAARFAWAKTVMEKLEARTGDDGMHEILTGCAHVFPDRHIARLREVYLEAMSRTGDRIKAVDAVLAFRGANRPWGEPGERQGNAIVISKKPRDPEAYAKAQTAEEKRRAYCFCPIIRERMEEGMPGVYCYCGAGWERRQWEGTIGEPVRVRVLHSALRGDDSCTFAVEIPGA